MTTSTISLHQRQIFAAPAGDPAAQLGSGVSGLVQLAANGGGVAAEGGADGKGLGPVLVQVDNHALLAIDQRGQLAAAEAFAATLQLGKDQQGQRDRESSGQQIVVGGEFKQMSKHQKIPER